MRKKDNVIAKLIDPGIIAVVRAQSREQVLALSEALLAGGVHAIEITTSTPKAIEAINEASQTLGERALIGVGTVLDVETCHAACEAGAEFVVSPVTKPELAVAAHEHDRPAGLDTPPDLTDRGVRCRVSRTTRVVVQPMWPSGTRHRGVAGSLYGVFKGRLRSRPGSGAWEDLAA